MRKIIFLTVNVVTLLLFTAFDNFACSCSKLPIISLEREVKSAQSKAKAVFAGEVIEIIQNPQVLFVEVKFKVTKVWKQDLPETVTVITGSGGGDCGFGFQVGKSYLVYALSGSKDKDELTARNCSRTTILSELTQDELKILGKGKKPEKINKKRY